MSSYSVAFSWKPTRWKEYYISRIISDLNQKISSGKYECGMHLTYEKQLASQYSISVSTVRKALSELEQWGLVETLNAKRTIVIETDPASHCSGTASTQGKHRLFCRWNYRLLPLLFNPMCIVYAAFLRTFRILTHGKAVNP